MTDEDAVNQITKIANYLYAARKCGTLEKWEVISIGWIAFCYSRSTWRPDGGRNERTYAERYMKMLVIDAVRGLRPVGYKSTYSKLPDTTDEYDDISTDCPYEATVSINEVLEYASRALTPREEYILRESLKDRSNTEIAVDLKITKERVRQIYKTALDVLESHFNVDK